MFTSVRSSIENALLGDAKTVRCRKCRSKVDIAKHLEGAPPVKVWRLDTRQTLVRCPKCKTFSRVFVYPLFNRVPPTRAFAEAAALGALSLVLLALRA